MNILCIYKYYIRCSVLFCCVLFYISIKKICLFAHFASTLLNSVCMFAHSFTYATLVTYECKTYRFNKQSKRHTTTNSDTDRVRISRKKKTNNNNNKIIKEEKKPKTARIISTNENKKKQNENNVYVFFSLHKK